MGIHNSHADVFLGLYNGLFADMVQHWQQPTQWNRDAQTVVQRTKKEGFSFLSKTLPALGKALDRALCVGYLDVPKSFRCKPGCRFPAFLQVLFQLVFDSEGVVLPNASVTAVADLRQLLFMSYKYEVPYDQNVIRDRLDKFVSTDQGLGWSLPALDNGEPKEVLHFARTLLHYHLRDIDLLDILPGHGPGAVAGGEKPWEKMRFKTLYTEAEKLYPYTQYFFANEDDLRVNASAFDSLEALPGGIAKGCFVPKDSRGPRFISMEPLELMWLQQGQKRLLYDHIESHVLTKGHVNFTDQTVNRQLALRGSIEGGISTLDMSDASDRISNWLVQALFPVQVYEALQATRSFASELPDGRIVVLNKFAPMGSALCFPVESLVHWALAVGSLVVSGVPQPRALNAIYVYGDDIIVVGEKPDPLLRIFPHFHLKFNEGKCCTAGNFRESCGMDAYKGEAISPIRVKKPFPSSPNDGDRISAWVAYANSTWDRCYYHLSESLLSLLKPYVGDLPIYGEDDSHALALCVSRFPGYRRYSGKRRWNHQLQRWERRTRIIRTHKLSIEPDRGEYLRTLVRPLSEKFWLKDLPSCKRGLGQETTGIYTVPHRVKTTWGWYPEY